MRNLFFFIFRYHAFFLFLILQVICLFLVISNNGYQRAAFMNVSDELVGRTMSAYKEVTGYLTLGESNKELAKENAQLRSHFPPMYYEDTSKVHSVHDSLRKQFYSFIPARVIQITTNESNNYILINKGSDEGIEPRMGVLGPQGVVGIVRSVSPHFAVLNSLLHSQTTVNARVGHNGQRGFTHWDGKSPDLIKLVDITRNNQIRKGDTIFTSGQSRLFPADIPVGTIQDFSIKESGNFYDITVKLATDYRRIDYVYVVNNMMRTEIDSLLNKNEHVQ